MNSYERIMNALAGDSSAEIPVAPIVREWCAKQLGFNFSDLVGSPAKHTFAQYYCAQEFDLDMLWDLFGIQVEAEAMGSLINRPANMQSVVSVTTPVIADYKKDLPKIKVPDPIRNGRIPLVLEGIRQLKELADERLPVLGYVPGPFRLASMLRGPEKLMQDCLRGDDGVEELLKLCINTVLVTGAATIHAGADLVWVGEPTSSADKISLDTLKRYVIPHLKKLIGALKSSHKVMIMMHVCGDTSDRIEIFRDTGIDALSISEKVDLAMARDVVGDDFCLWGNVAPETLLNGTPSQVEDESKACLKKGMGHKGRFVLCSGCKMPTDAPAENIRAMVKVARTYRS
jgi:uroporphyrinogen decarboxylase